MPAQPLRAPRRIMIVMALCAWLGVCAVTQHETLPLFCIAAEEAKPAAKLPLNEAFYKAWQATQEKLALPAASAPELQAGIDALQQLATTYDLPAALQYGCHQTLGHAYARLPKPREAMEQLQAAHALQPDDWAGLIDIANQALLALKVETATTAFKQLLNTSAAKEWHPWAKRRLSAAAWIGRPTPDFALRDSHGADIEREQLHDMTILIDCWAGWSMPWRRQVEALKQLHASLQDNAGVFLFGLNHDANVQTMQAFVDEYQLPWQNVWPNGGRDNDASRSLGVTAIPTLLIIDRAGIIRYHDFPADFPPAEVLRVLLPPPEPGAEKK